MHPDGVRDTGLLSSAPWEEPCHRLDGHLGFTRASVAVPEDAICLPLSAWSRPAGQHFPLRCSLHQSLQGGAWRSGCRAVPPLLQVTA